MKAMAVYPGRHDIGLVEHEDPQIIEADEVKLRIVETGICGTDREICAFHYGTPPQGSDYLVIGHETFGEIVEVGEGVTMLKPGDLVIPMVRRPCPHDHCVACRSGRQDFCYTGDFTERGIKERHGYMSEFVVDRQQYMVPIPASLRDVAVLGEPLTIAEKALIQVNQVQQRLPWACRHNSHEEFKKAHKIKDSLAGLREHHCHTAVVLGAGPVGLLGAMAFSAAGFKTFVYSREAAPHLKSEIVEAIGGTYVSAMQHSVAALGEMAGDISLVYEAVGASSLAFEVMQVLGTNGVFVFTGVPGRKAPAPVDTDLLMRNLVLKNQVTFGTVNAGRDAFEAAIRDLTLFKKLWPDAVRAMITGRYRIDKAPPRLLDATGSIKDVVCYA